MKKIIFAGACLLMVLGTINAQEKTGEKPERKELRLNLNESGSHFLKATLMNQIWVRFNENNPGSKSFGYDLSRNSFDVGIRRLRFQLFGQLTDKVFFYTQFGENNFNVASTRFSGAFFHDAIMEYKVKDRYLSVGAGLSAWGGYLRFSAPSVGGIMGLDAPLYQQATNSTTDQFLRKLGVYFKGKLGKLDYRVMIANPMAPQGVSPALPIAPSSRSNFSMMPAQVQTQAYFQYQFLDEETNLNPYNQGSYFGAKRIFNVGAGFVNQKNAMWHQAANGDTVQTAMTLFGMDVFYDAPINTEKGTAFSGYAAFSNNEFGPAYLRTNNAMNISNGTSPAPANLSGPGNAFPMLGTGTTAYAQLGYKFRKALLPNNGTLMPYTSIQHSNFKALKDRVNIYEAGVNWLINGNNQTKITLGVQNRPVFSANSSGEGVQTGRRNQVVLQLQIGF